MLIKYLKINKRSNLNFLYKNKLVIFGYYGIKVVKFTVVYSKQLEVIRRLISRIGKRKIIIFFRIFFYHPRTKKPLNSRMGKGIGQLFIWVAYIKKGSILLELSNVTFQLSSNILKLIKLIFNFKIFLVTKKIINKWLL